MFHFQTTDRLAPRGGKAGRGGCEKYRPGDILRDDAKAANPASKPFCATGMTHSRCLAAHWKRTGSAPAPSSPQSVDGTFLSQYAPFVDYVEESE